MDDSLVELTDSRLAVILDERELNYDWSAEVINDASIEDLDAKAIELAREGYKQREYKINNFLRKLRKKGLVANTTIAGNKSTWALVNN